MLPAPMGWAVLLQHKPDTRKTWDDHAIDGFYIETSKKHYQCCKIWVKNTRIKQVADMVFFKHQYIAVPTITKADAIVVASTKLVKVLQGEIPANIRDQEKKQLIRLATIIYAAATQITSTDTKK